MAIWQTVRLGDIIETNKNTYSKKENWNFINYLDTGNITLNKVDKIQNINVDIEKLPSRARRKVKYNSIIYSTVRPNQLHHGIVKNQPDNFLVSTGFVVIDVDNNKAVPDYIYYILNQQEITEHLQDIAEQSVSTYPSIKPSDIENLEVIMPDIDTQKRIVSILDTIDRKITQNEKINNNLLEHARLMYKNRFIDMTTFDGIMPNEWHMGTVSEIIKFHDSKRVPLSSRERTCLEKIYPYYGATSVMDYVDRYLFDGVYLLIGEDGTVIDNKGFPILQYVEGKFWVNNHAHIITGKNGYSVELLYLLLSMTNVQSIVTGAVQPKISQANLNKLPVVIPSTTEIQSFDSIIQPIFSQIRILRAENDRLATTRDTLLPKLMSGELDISDIDI